MKASFAKFHGAVNTSRVSSSKGSLNCPSMVFISKKRTPTQQTFSEFKGGDLNKYTARSYAIENGNEIFGGLCSFKSISLSKRLLYLIAQKTLLLVENATDIWDIK
uniref:Uncharacterized protein n=1 Tax=Parascaris equorum TaxID=6256 RepID=A0A914S4Y4_PAREQ